MNLRHLRFQVPASQAIPEQLFEAIHGIFRETPVMITRGPFPGRQPLLGDGRQRLGARLIGRPRHRIRPGRHHQVAPALGGTDDAAPPAHHPDVIGADEVYTDDY